MALHSERVRRCGRRASTAGPSADMPGGWGEAGGRSPERHNRGRGHGGVGVDAGLHGRLSRRAVTRPLPSRPQGELASPALALASPT